MSGSDQRHRPPPSEAIPGYRRAWVGAVSNFIPVHPKRIFPRRPLSGCGKGLWLRFPIATAEVFNSNKRGLDDVLRWYYPWDRMANLVWEPRQETWAKMLFLWRKFKQEVSRIQSLKDHNAETQGRCRFLPGGIWHEMEDPNKLSKCKHPAQPRYFGKRSTHFRGSSGIETTLARSL